MTSGQWPLVFRVATTDPNIAFFPPSLSTASALLVGPGRWGWWVASAVVRTPTDTDTAWAADIFADSVTAVVVLHAWGRRSIAWGRTCHAGMHSNFKGEVNTHALSGWMVMMMEWNGCPLVAWAEG